MAVNLAAANNQAMATALNTAIGTSAQILIYSNGSGTPANADATAVGNLLVTLTGNATAFGTVSGGIITLSAVTSGTAVGTGTQTAGYCRILTSGGTKMLDLTVIGTSGPDIALNTTSITLGGTVSITSGTITFPA